jgi:hypothetical protein
VVIVKLSVDLLLAERNEKNGIVALFEATACRWGHQAGDHMDNRGLRTTARQRKWNNLSRAGEILVVSVTEYGMTRSITGLKIISTTALPKSFFRHMLEIYQSSRAHA